MQLRRYLAIVPGLALIGALAAAAKDDSRPEGNVIARIHFAGMKQIEADPDAKKINDIRAMPASAALRGDFLRKLSTTPFRVMNRNSPARKNDNAALMRPLIEDMLDSESYLEISGASNVWPELALAVKVDNARAEVWRSNLAKALTDWTAMSVTDTKAEGFKGWELKKHHEPNSFQFFRAGDWVVFGWGKEELTLVAGILKNIKQDKRPVGPLKKSWLDAWADWPAFEAYHPLPIQLPKMELSVEPRKEFLRPELKLHFARPLGLKIEPWQIPTNVIYNPIASLTLARGFGPLLSQVPAVREINAEPPPNQAVMWALPQIMFETCAAAPVRDSRNYLMRVAPGLISLINTNMLERHLQITAQLTTNMSVAVHGMMVLSPFLRATNDGTGDYLVGGIFAPPLKVKPFPWSSLMDNINGSDVVYYDWEMNGERLAQWHALSQLYFIMSDGVLPKLDTPAQVWLTNIQPRLEECRTVGRLTAPNELTAVRNSTLGLTGFELTCLAYWEDSPGFPLDFKVEAMLPTGGNMAPPPKR